LQDTLRVLDDLTIGESKDHEARGSKPPVALDVVKRSRKVMRPIRLDHEVRLLAEEIDDVWAQRLLPSKLCAQPPIAE
jgi:hypothetical protein